MKKVYIVRKYIIAKNAKDALRLEKKAPVDDIWAEEDSHKDLLKAQLANLLNNELGFKK